MKSMRSGILSMVVLLIANAAVGQGVQSVPIDLTVTADALHANHIGGQSLWMQGGALELGARVYRGVGIAARVEGLHSAPFSAAAEPLSLVTAVFGPRYTMETHSHRYAIFGEGLVGISNGFDSLFSEGSGPVGSVNAGTTSSSNALATDVGGGFDVQINHHFALRAFRASYLRTQFPNTTTNVQNSLSLSAGVVVRFGR